MTLELCIVDVETTGLHPEDGDEITEVAAVRWSVDHGIMLACFSAVVYSEKAPHAVSKFPHLGSNEVPSRDMVVGMLQRFSHRSDFIVAHRAEFDRSFLPELDDRRWICSKRDIEWPIKAKDSTLVQTCVAHGVPIINAHRALDDCMLIAGLFNACRADMPGLINDALLPRTKVVALVTFDEKDKAKSLGFEWNADRKIWWKSVRNDRLKSLPFQYREME